MAEEQKKENVSKISRREFLKDAGLVVGGATIGSMAILGACSGDTKTVTETVTTTASGSNSTVTVTTPGTTVTTTVTAGADANVAVAGSLKNHQIDYQQRGIRSRNHAGMAVTIPAAR